MRLARETYECGAARLCLSYLENYKLRGATKASLTLRGEATRQLAQTCLFYLTQSRRERREV